MSINTGTTNNGIAEFCSDKTVPMRFLLPDCWEVSNETDGDSGYSVLISGIHEASCVGQITLQVFPLANGKQAVDAPAEHIQQYSDQLKSAGYHLGGAPVSPCSPILGFDTGVIYSPTASFDGHRFDTPVLAFENDEYTVLLGLIGICQDESPEWWAINKRAFEIVRDSLRVGEQAAQEKNPPQPLAAPPSTQRPKFPNAGLIACQSR